MFQKSKNRLRKKGSLFNNKENIEKKEKKSKEYKYSFCQLAQSRPEGLEGFNIGGTRGNHPRGLLELFRLLNNDEN